MWWNKKPKPVVLNNHFKVKYEYYCDNLPSARLSLYLIPDESYKLPHLLRNKQKFGDEEFYEFWGRNYMLRQSSPYLTKVEFIYGNDWNMIKEKVLERIAEVTQILKEAYKQNKEKVVEKVPKKETFIITFE